jgi:putative MFS transporter
MTLADRPAPNATRVPSPAAPSPQGAVPTASAVSAAWSRHRVSRTETRKGTGIALLAWVFAVYDFILFGTLLPAIQSDFGWSNATAVATATTISVGTALVVFGVGPLVDRLGRRKGMLMTVAGTALASAATAATFNPSYLVAVRSIGGLGLAEQSVNTTYLNEIYALSEDETITKRRGFIYSIVQGGWPLGTLLAAAFAAALLPTIGWRGCFLVATFPALVIVALRRKLKETPQFQIHNEVRTLRKAGDTAGAQALAAEYGIDTDRKTPIREIFSGATRRNTLVLGLAWFTNWFGIQTFSVLGTSVLTQGKGVDFAGALLMFIVINLVAFTGYLFHGWAGDRYGRRNVIAVAWVISGVLFAAMLLFATGTVAIVALYSAGMFFLVGPYSAMLFYMGECYPTDCRATGASLINAISQPGAIVAGIIVTSLLASGVAWSDTALYVGAAGTFVSGFVMLACKKVSALDTHTAAGTPAAAV